MVKRFLERASRIAGWSIFALGLLALGAGPDPAACKENDLPARGGRTVGQRLVHVLDVRRAWIEQADKARLAGLPKISREQGHDRCLLMTGFERTGEALADLIEAGVAGRGRAKGYAAGIVVLVSYLIAHEAHHRGTILLTLKQSGFKLNDRLRWGLWDWNRIAREVEGAKA